MQALAKQRVGRSKRLRHWAKGAIRQALALLLSSALPATTLPVELPGNARAVAPARTQRQPAQPLDAPYGLSRRKHDAGTAGAAGNPRNRTTLNATAPSNAPATLPPTVKEMALPASAASPAPARAASTPSNVVTIPFSFGGQSIAAGNDIWFTSALTVSGIHSEPVTVFVRSASIQFTANGKTYNLPVPDGNLVFSSTVTSATTSFDATHNLWTTYVPAGLRQSCFSFGAHFSGAFRRPAGRHQSCVMDGLILFGQHFRGLGVEVGGRCL